MTLTKEDYQELFNTLSPRMQKQLIEYATEFESIHNNLADELNNTIPPTVSPYDY